MKNVLGALGIVVAAIISGVVLVVLWGWFIVPLGVPALKVAHGIGFCLVTSFLTHKVDQRGEIKITSTNELPVPFEITQTKRDFTEILVESVIYDLVVLGLGFIAHLAM
jgi:hypothetical protein